MGLFRQLALSILAISLLTFVALFGQLPRLRKTPIGYTHRFLRYAVPRWLGVLDRQLTGGICGPSIKRCGLFLINDKHPLVMGFYLTLVSAGLYMFISDGWDYLTTFQKSLVFLIAPLPYITIYAAAYSDPGIITPRNSPSAWTHYPYDLINFFPSHACRTCHFTKPARSKHCSICRGCIAKHDHHCIWINNCVGLSNTRHFLAFLFATNIFLALGVALSSTVLLKILEREGISMKLLPSLMDKLHLFGLVILDQAFVGAVFLLSVLTGILSMGFTGYHLYLIWAGTTTNETSKWADWKDDIQAGLIFMADEDDENSSEEVEHEDACKTWPRETKQHFYRIVEPNRTDELPRGVIWKRVESLEEVDNIYDLGGWRNLLDVLFPPKLVDDDGDD